jgi:hypothetical protein
MPSPSDAPATPGVNLKQSFKGKVYADGRGSCAHAGNHDGDVLGQTKIDQDFEGDMNAKNGASVRLGNTCNRK